MSKARTSTTASTVIGYARVSTIGQTLEQQMEALAAAGAGKVFHDVMSGARDDRPGFAECMRYLREGDTLIVWRLDRLGRNMRGIINTLHELTGGGHGAVAAPVCVSGEELTAGQAPPETCQP